MFRHSLLLPASRRLSVNTKGSLMEYQTDYFEQNRVVKAGAIRLNKLAWDNAKTTRSLTGHLTKETSALVSLVSRGRPADTGVGAVSQPAGQSRLWGAEHVTCLRTQRSETGVSGQSNRTQT
jgi:hypothetical protein